MGSITLIKFVKDPLLYLWCHADARIREADGQPVLVHEGTDRDLTACRSEFDGIVQQIIPDMRSQFPVAFPDDRIQIRIDYQIFFGPDRLPQQDALPNLFIHMEGFLVCDDRLILQTGQT